MPAKYRWLNACVAMGGVVLLSGCEQKPFEILPPIPTDQLEVLGVQAPLKSVHFRDKQGEGLLVLSRVDGQATDADTEQEVDRVVLKATLYERAGDKAFTPRWNTEQETTCAGLDLDVDFYTDVSDVTDLDDNGVAEVTIANHAYCGGGIEPQGITIELREGQSVYSLTGQSLISPAGEEPFGGEREDGASFKSAPKALHEHMESVWQQVYKRPWSEVSAPSDVDPEDDTQ